MKFWIILILFSTPFDAFSEETLVTKEINAFTKLSACLDSIPDSEIINPDHKIAKNLSLITSVIEDITLQLGRNESEQKEFRSLYNIALKHCKIEIEYYRNIQQQNMEKIKN